MATEVSLPALGESVTEGTVTQWLKSVGDEVAVDEPLLEVSTDKVDTEIPSPVAGTLLEVKAAEDETVEVGAVLALIGEKDEATDESATGSGDSSPAQEESDQSTGDEATTQSSEPSNVPATPGTDEGASETPPSEQESAAKADAEPATGGDATEVKLPALGESVTEGTVTQWLKSVGDDVAVDEPLLEVSTDKVDTEIPSPVAGTLLDIVVQADETVEVGAVLARVGSAQEGSAGGDGSGSAEQDSGSAAPKPADTSDAAEDAAEDADARADEADKDADDTADDTDDTADDTDDTAEDTGSETEPAAQGDSGAQPQAEQVDAPTPEPSRQQPEAQQPPSEAAKSPVPRQAESGDDERSYVTPLVRKLAAQHEVDLSTITGTGVGGRIRKQDVLEAAAKAQRQKDEEKQAAAAPAAEPAPATPAAAAPSAAEPSPLRGQTVKMSRLRKVIAARMVESLQVSAQLTTVVEVDVTAISRLRERVKAAFEAREGVRLSFLPFFAKAAVDALKTYPMVNASIDTEAGEVTYHAAEHLGVAVDTERGLLVPVIKEAGDLSIAGLARKIADLAARTRDNKITPDELSGGTFTLTNTGSRGALFDTPIINQPQVAILGTGTVVKRPVVISDANLGETIAIRQMVYLALTYDHRIVDGADAARFLSAVKQRLEEANFEAELGF